MAFHEQSFSNRFAAMGDEAEGVFEQVFDMAFERYGLNRPSVKVNALPPFIRYTPDYITTYALIEVQGFGSDNKIKFKDDKLQALREWHKIMPVKFFLYHRQSHSYVFVDLDVLMFMLKAEGVHDSFHDGNGYVWINRNCFQWTKVDEGTKL